MMRDDTPDRATCVEWAAFFFLFILAGLGGWGAEMLVERWLG